MKEELELTKDFLKEVFPTIVVIMLVVTVVIALSVGLLSLVNLLKTPTKTIYEIQFNEQQLERIITVLEKVHENN